MGTGFLCVFPQSNNNIKNKKGYEDVELVRHKVAFMVGNAAETNDRRDGVLANIHTNTRLQSSVEHEDTTRGTQAYVLV